MSGIASKLRQRSNGLPWRMTELGNAERLASEHGHRLRYVAELDMWLCWDGKRWNPSKTGAEMSAAKDVARAWFADAAEVSRAAAGGDEGASKLAERMLRHAAATSKASGIRAMLTLAQSESPIAATLDMFDRDQFVLNALNGTIDLHTGELRPHRQADMITKLAPVAYDPTATCPVFDAFVARVLVDEELRAFVQRYLGYALTGSVREQLMAFFYGLGANGKTTLLEAFLSVLGDYGKQGAPDLLLAKQGEAHPTEVADLQGARLVVCQEIDQGRTFSEQRIKSLTGGDMIKARRMRCDFYEFPPTHKIVVAANHKPKVRGQDEAIWRRIRLVPFSVTIPKGERDKELMSKLQAEASGILAWSVRGCLDWQRDGLGEPAAVTEATATYQADQDHLGGFLEELCVVAPGVFTRMEPLYAAYSSWCERSGSKPWSQPTVRERLLERQGIEEYRTKSARGIRGVGLQTNHELVTR